MVEKRFALPERCIGPVDWINREHQELLDCLKLAAEQAEHGPISDVDGAFKEMFEKISRHFAHEEALMAKTGFPGLEWHKGHHAQVLARARQTIERCHSRGFVDQFDIDRMFDQAVLDMSRADGKFFEFLEQSGQLDSLE